MLATPPGLEPMPRAQDSVPRTGALSRPVKMMSRKTVPVRIDVAGRVLRGAQPEQRVDAWIVSAHRALPGRRQI